MINHNQIRSTIITEIYKLAKSKRKDISDSVNLELDLGIDSLNKVELASNLLDIFKLDDAPLEDIANVQTVGQVVDFVVEILQQKEK